MVSSREKRPAVFIDRDGTLIEEVNFLSRVDDLRMFPFTGDAIQLLKRSGFRVVVVTNQSGIGRKLYTEADMHTVHKEIQTRLRGGIDAFYFCPHMPDAACRCRKPGLGMIEDAVADLNIDLNGSWMVGDKQIDVETGRNAGIRSALVLTGYGSSHLTLLDWRPEIVEEDLLAAVRKIVHG